MKHKLLIGIGVLILHSAFGIPHLSASDAVEPATITITNLREEAISYASDAFYYHATTLRLTNCVLFTGTTTNSSRQGLSDVAIEVKMGSTTTNVIYAGTAQVETNGTWYCNILVPTNPGACYIQVKITDVNTNIFIYPWKMLNRKTPL